MKKRMLNGSLAIALALTTVPLNIFPHVAKAAGTVDSTVKLRFMETTDLHDNVMDYDYYKDAPTVEFGLDRTAKLINQARAEKTNPSNPASPTYDQNSMLFDAGDLLQGNPMADYVARVKKLGATEVHPMFKAMGMLKYDAGIVGNHEFNYGLDFLNNALEEAPYNVVNANIYNATTGNNYFTPYKIIDKVVKDENGVDQTIKVGVIGFAPPQILQWDHDNLAGKVTVEGIVDSAKKFIPQMKADGADIIVAIAHSGCDVTAPDQADAENAVYALSTVPGIDALLFGHAHVNFPGDSKFNNNNTIDNVNGHLNNVPAMEAGFWGNNLGVMDLDLQKVDGKWQVASSKAALRPIYKKVKDANGVSTSVPLVDGPDQAIVDAVKDYHDGTLNYVRGKIGATSAPLYSFFAQVQDDPTIQIVNNAQTEYVKKAIADKPELKDLPVLSAGAPFKAGGRSGVSYYTNIPTGELSIKSANDLYLYPNTLKAVQVTGATVKEWLEMSAGQFFQVDPNKTTPQQIVNDDFPSYNYDVIDGVKYQIDLTQAPRYDKNGNLINPDSHRIVNLTMPDGSAVDPNQQFIVATNNYRAGGGGNFPGLKGGIGKIVVDSPDESRQVLINYITAKGTVNPSADNNWKFAPVGGNAVLQFNSSPDAKVYADGSSNVKDAGANPDGSGFELYTLDQNKHVQLLGINDYHGQLDTWRSIKDSTGKVVDYSGGIEYLAAYLKQREATNPLNTLMVQAGDLVGASPPVSALLQDEPTIRFMNELGFDVGTIGNHEFDEGVTEMKRLIYGGDNPKTAQYEAKYGKFTGSTMDYVVANVVDENTNEPILPPYVVKEVDGVKIGFIGVVTTETPTIVTPTGTAGVKFTDEVEAVNKYAKVLEDQGVKTIVVLAHDPGTSKTDGTAATGKVVDMAKAIDPEVDVIYGAHDHKYLNTTVDGKLLVQSWSYGTALSDVDLTFDPTTGDLISKRAEVVDTLHSKITPDAKIKAELDGYQEDIKPIVSRVMGSTTDGISKDANESGESPLGNLIADGMRAVTGTQLAFMNSGGIRNPLPAGTITWGDLFKVQPFGNDLVTMDITGDQIRTLLNQQFNAPPGYNKIMAISGLHYTWSNTNPYGSKVVDIYLENGSKIDPNASYSITVNNFMADGGDGFTILKQGKNRLTNMVDLDGFVQYFQSLPQPVSAKVEGRVLLVDTMVDQPDVYVTNFDRYITGTTEPGAKVVANVDGKALGTATADDEGYFEIKMDKFLTKGTVIRLDITDKAGNLAPFDITVESETGWVLTEDEKGNDVYYYVDPTTEELYKNKWLKDDGLWYHFNKDGIMETGWVKVNSKWYFLDEEGAMLTGWYQENGKWYFLDKVNGDMKVNWSKVNGKWYFFNTSGAMLTGWVSTGGKWYFLDQTNGDMKTGWVLTGNHWYFLAGSGAMQTGWVAWNGKWYFLYDNGSMAVSTTIGGKYKVDSHGAWIK